MVINHHNDIVSMQSLYESPNAIQSVLCEWRRHERPTGSTVLTVSFWGKQDECLETDKIGQTTYSLFRHGREIQQQQQAICIL